MFFTTDGDSTTLYSMDRKKALEEYVKMVEEGRPFSEDFIGKTRDVEDDALRARNLSEEALASQVLKNTGIPIPGKEAPRLKQEDFYNRIIKEQYPELEPNVVLEPSNYAGGYEKGKIDLNSDMAKVWTPERNVGTILHEAGHQYDDQIAGKVGKNLDMATLRKLQSKGMNLKDLDPTTVYELYAQAHHAPIPQRGGSTFGLGGLKSFLKSGKFKGIAPPLIGAALTAASGDASASDFIPGLDQAGDIGESREDEGEMLGNAQGSMNYKMSDARRDALQALKRR
jgi:hypothetical protein